MERIKKRLRPFYLWYFNFDSTKLGKRINLISNFYHDYILYKKYATAFSKKDEDKLKPWIDIPESEKIICLIPIGEATESFNTTLSKRRPIEETLIIKN